jgi:class 3 adenylate cyclase
MKPLSIETFPVTAAVVSIGMGLCVLLSWATGVSPLRGTFWTSISMNPLTAVEFVLCGVSLAWQAAADSRRRVARVLAALVVGLAFAKLLSFVGIDGAVDRWLFADRLDFQQAFPNRMAPNTALNFVFIGLALFFLRTRTAAGRWVSEGWVIPPMLITLCGLTGYAYANVALTQIGAYIPIAFNTIVTFAVLCLGILLTHADTGIVAVFRQRTAGATIGKRFLPFVLIMPLSLGWLVTRAELSGVMSAQFGIALLSAMGASLAVAVLWVGASLVNRLEEQLAQQRHAEAERRINRLKRFFPPAIANKIVSGEIDDPFKWHRNDVTVIFIDLRGFTSYAELAEPEDVMRMLQEYYATVAKVAQKYGGSIGHLAGDGVMIFFNDPVPVEAPQKKAVRMALEIRDELRRDERLPFGAGIASGYTTIGGIGAEGFWDYTIIGTTTNLASRLCSAAIGGQILVSQHFLKAISDEVSAESIGSLTLKGLRQPIAAYNVVGLRPMAEVQA